ncbi:MAG TPA: PfkB family carbohydrate kinase [Candidatus Paceibacterota bacterium]|nr:PfkB family carbohydrate kinase [Candidatus Paceibacterota bacterium]
MSKTVEVLAIGDIVTDAFIKLKDASVHCKLDKTACELCVRFGDKVPYESVEVIKAVGNSANAAVSASRLGLTSALLSTVGNDQNGKDCLEELEKNGVLTDFMATNENFPTNYHYVLWYDVERTILVNHAPFPYSLPADMSAPKWIYLTSMGETSEAFHHEIVKYLESNPEVKLAFQPGTFQMKLGKEKLADVYKHSDIFFCNVEEAQRILGTEEKNHKNLMNMLAGLGPKHVVMTDGINGAYAFDGEKYFFMPVYPHTPYERTGAGDAYASTIVSMLAKGKTLGESLIYAPINSMSVVQQVGAQKGLLSMDKIEEFIKNAPEDYKLKEI